MSTRYQLFEANTIKLVESLVIKSTDSVDALNQWVTDYYGSDLVNTNDPHTWKYYMNISGEYHFTDQVMEVVSWDNLETIVFSKETLAIHRATFKAYAYGSTQYMDLVKKYPDQELLIRGILNPVDIDVAINAENGTVLTYDSSLVEENEYSLISKITQWVKSFKERWVNEQFNISDDLYASTHHAIMYMHLVPAVLNFRLHACKTNEAHSYHIMEYLLSHGLPQYSIMHMTKKQMLFFYRNIKYIQRNAGSVDTFKWILDHIMTERFLPISEYLMKHNSDGQLESLLPTVQFRNRHLNDIYGASDQDKLSTTELLFKEDGIALGNPQWRVDEAENIEKDFQYSMSSTVATKVLESAIVDYTESGQNRVEEVLLHHWLYFAVTGKYKAYIGITNPKTEERIPLSAKDAFTLMIYAWARSMEIDMTYIPNVLAKRVMRMPTPSKANLMSLVDSTRVKSSVAQEMIDLMPVVTDIISTEAFNSLGNKIFNALSAQMKMSAREEHFYSRALVQNMAYGLYCDVLCELEPEGTMYSQWFADRTLDFTDFSRQEFEDLYVKIIEEMSGMDLVEEPNLVSLQNAMIKLFEYLSSYSIQFVKKINNNGLISLQYPIARIGDMAGASSALMEFYDSAIDLLDYGLQTKPKLSLSVYNDEANGHANVQEILTMMDRYRLQLELNTRVHYEPSIVRSYYQFDIAPVYIDNIEVISL